MHHALTSLGDFSAFSLVFLGHVHTIATCGKSRKPQITVPLAFTFQKQIPTVQAENLKLDSWNSKHNSFRCIFVMSHPTTCIS